jgi:hypothetical protein
MLSRIEPEGVKNNLVKSNSFSLPSTRVEASDLEFSYSAYRIWQTRKVSPTQNLLVSIIYLKGNDELD